MSADCCLLMCASPNVQALINATLRPGSILYVPRAYFHETSTASDAIAAPPTYADESLRSEDMGTQEGALPDVSLMLLPRSRDAPMQTSLKTESPQWHSPSPS